MYVYIPDEAYWCTPTKTVTNGILDHILSSRNVTSFNPNNTVEQKVLSTNALLKHNKSFSSIMKDLIIPKNGDGKFKGCYMYNVRLHDIEVSLRVKVRLLKMC